MIIQSAVKVWAIIFTWKRHCDCFAKLYDATMFYKRKKWEEEIQWFMTDTHKFLDRKEAMIHFKECNQISRDELKWDELYSENLY
jgi:hypothetical protein